MSIGERKPNYDYPTRGLDITSRTIRGGEDKMVRRVHVTDIPRVDKDHESWQRAGEAIQNPRRQGQFGYALIPPVHDEGIVEVYHFPWGGYSSNDVGINEMAMYAAARPNHTIVAVDSPATGASSRLPSAVSREIAKTGSYMPYGELFTGAFEGLLADFEQRIFSGSSQGARRSIGVAACVGNLLALQTDYLALQEPVGSHSQEFLSLVRAFLIREAAHNKRYIEASPDDIAAEAQQNNDTFLRTLSTLARTAFRGGLANQFFQEPKAMAKSGFEQDFTQALPHVKKAIISSAELSELTHSGDVENVVRRVSGTVPNVPIEHRILKAQTHAMNAGNPGVLGVVLSRDLPPS